MKKLFTEPLPGEKYFIYFMHMQPESTTSAQAPLYLTQDYLLENIAVTLPQKYKLYIKEHYSDFGNRGKEFYDKFKHYPNIRLIDPYKNSKQLIANASGIITITGTAGFEALLLEKPVVIFGNVFYDFLGSVKKVNDFNKLYDTFRQIEFKENVGVTPAEDEPHRIASSYIKSLYKGYVNPYYFGHDLASEGNIADVTAAMRAFMNTIDEEKLLETVIKYKE